MLHLTISSVNLHLASGRTDSDALGQCEPLPSGDYKIIISDGLNDERFAEVTLHELIEAANMIYDLEMTHTQIQTLGVALAEVLPKGTGAQLRMLLAPKPEGKAKRTKAR
jgi:hypothetical protein